MPTHNQHLYRGKDIKAPLLKTLKLYILKKVYHHFIYDLSQFTNPVPLYLSFPKSDAFAFGSSLKTVQEGLFF